jgi:hypothetical protein
MGVGAKGGHPSGYLYRTAMNVFRSRYWRAARTLKRAVGVAPEPDVFEIVDCHYAHAG